MKETTPHDTEPKYTITGRAGRKTHYSDAAYVNSLKGDTPDDRIKQDSFYKEWRNYFENSHRALFFNLGDAKMEIIHNVFTITWEKVRLGAINTQGETLVNRNGEPFSSSLFTYMMGIARLNYREHVRTDKMDAVVESDLKGLGHKSEEDDGNSLWEYLMGNQAIDEAHEFGEPSTEQVMREIVAETIMQASERCMQILQMFYYKEMSLDAIMNALGTFSSKDALKTAKNKCLERIKTSARQAYCQYLNQ
ncbi:MAG: hypothetical protein PUD40_06965 [Bacteroidales bacterium]|nr:hypothetical protein [Bacteroidales bacterium]